MRKRVFDGKTKAKVVLEGLRGRPTSELCTEYQISEHLYYQWREKFLAEAARVFDSRKQGGREERLLRENARLKALVGELTMELKKSDGEGW
jgi:transposase-like protein